MKTQDAEKDNHKTSNKQVPLSHIEFLKLKVIACLNPVLATHLSEIAVLQEFLDSCTR